MILLISPFSKSIPLVSILWKCGSSIKNFKACVFVFVCLFVSKHVSVGGTAAPHMSNNLSFSLFPSNHRQPPPHSCAGRRKSKASSLVFNKESTGEKTKKYYCQIKTAQEVTNLVISKAIDSQRRRWQKAF